MAFIWEDYEKEQERRHRGVSRTKGFRYPPILPIIYYEGTGKWKAPLRLRERIFLSDMLGEYIPDYRCIIVQLSEYTNNKLMEKKDELSLIMMLNKLHGTEDFVALQDEVPPEYLEKVTSHTPEYLLGIIGQIIEILLAKLNVPEDEARRFADQVKERNVGELFANFKGYDVQETRRIAKEEGIEEGRNEGIKEGIKKGRNEGRKEGLEALVSSLKPLLPDFEAVYNAIIKNRSYADYTRDEVMKYY